METAQLARICLFRHEMETGPGAVHDAVRVAGEPHPASVRIPGEHPVRVQIEDLREAVVDLRTWRGRLAARFSLLPEGSPGAAELLGSGDDPSVELYIDNCHLTAAGCDRAARALANRIVRLLGE